MGRGHRDNSVLFLCCILALAPVSGSRSFGSCSVKLPPPGQNSCDAAWMIDVTNADLAPFATCENKSWPDSVQTNDRAVTRTSQARLAHKKSACSQVDIDIADLTYISVHVCKCLNCSLETKTILHNRDVWSSSRIYKPGFPSAGRRLRHVYCLWQLLAKTSRTSCHIQENPNRHILLCQTQSAYSKNGCFRIWWQHRMCEGFVTCKALSSPHTCNSLFKKNSQIRMSASSSEYGISLRDLKLYKHEPFIGSNLMAPELLSADVTQKREDTFSSHYSCANCSALTSHRQKRDTECPPGFFGLACSSKCHCRLDKRCYINGTCFSGRCDTGWEGNSCDRRACPTGKYGFTYTKGQACTANCSCPKDAECNVVHGACSLSDCSNVTFAVGQTFNCLEAKCPRRKLFYPKCLDTCHCALDSVCDPVSGVCPTPVCNGSYEPPTCSKLITDTGMHVRAILLRVVELSLLILKVSLVIKIRLLPAIVQSFTTARRSFIASRVSLAEKKQPDISH